MIRRKGLFDVRPDRLVRGNDVYDDIEARRPTRVKFIPRRGPAQITWPLKPERALRLLTGRKTLARALDAYASFVRAYRARKGFRPITAESICEDALEASWTKENFKRIADGYWQYPRRGFQVKNQKERISKLFRDLGLK
jgi:hypothetical protein